MKKILLFVTSILLLYTNSFCQVTLSELTGTAGDNSSNSEFNMEWSVGETAVETYTGDYILSQGLQQGNYVLTGIEGIEKDGIEISLYPNPASNVLHISYVNENTTSKHWQLTIADISGRLIFNQLFEENKQDIDLSAFPPGIYYFRLTGYKDTIRTFKIVKY